MSFKVQAAIKTKNPLNGSYGHWTSKVRQRKAQREGIQLVLKTYYPRQDYRVQFPVEVHLVRIAPSGGLDDDALPAALKSIRDGVADWLGLSNDRTPNVKWTYDQRRGLPRQYAVEVIIRPLEAPRG